MKTNYILFYTLLLFSMGIHSQTNALIDSLQRNLSRSYTFYEKSIVLQNKVSEDFDLLMNELAATKNSGDPMPVSENLIQDKLHAMALYKKQHPELFDEIASTYIYGVNNPGFRAPSSPQLEAKHILPDYRLVWEYFLLKPVSGKAAAQYDQRIRQALSLLNDPRSVSTVESVYKNTLQESSEQLPSIISKRKLLLLTLAEMPSSQSLKTLVKLATLDKTSQIKGIEEKWNSEEYIKKLLTGYQPLKTKQSWDDLIRKTNVTTFDTEGRRVFSSLKNR